MSVLRYGGAAAFRLTLRLGAVPDSDIASCVVVYEAQMRGWLAVAARAQTGADCAAAYESLASNLTLYCGMRLLPFDLPAASIFDDLKASRIRIGTPDLKIAAIALANNATVITRNARHLGKVPGLHFEDWTIPN